MSPNSFLFNKDGYSTKNYMQQAKTRRINYWPLGKNKKYSIVVAVENQTL